MSKEFVPYDIALSMKELGYEEDGFAYYEISTEEIVGRCDDSFKKVIHAPLYQQAFRWLLEEVVNKEDYMITRNGGNADFWDGQVYGKSSRTGRAGWQYESQGVSYREAQEACLRKLIEIVKEKRDENN